MTGRVLMPELPQWSLIIHGGAKSIRPHRETANRQGCLAAAQAGCRVLRDSGTSLEAVEAVVRVLEDDPVFNAGYGSVLNAEGAVEMDAALMDGTSLDIGAVAAIQGIRNPISVARLLLRETPVLLVADGAMRYAREHGAKLCAREMMISHEQFRSVAQSNHDTVGCVARDVSGAIAVGTSTGGLTGKLAGRVGDSPLPGCGFYADDMRGGAALSGDGESIAKMMLAAHVMQQLEIVSAQSAATSAIERLSRIGGEAGAIVIDKSGQFGVAHNSEHFALALASDLMNEPRVALHRNELKDLLDNG